MFLKKLVSKFGLGKGHVVRPALVSNCGQIAYSQAVFEDIPRAPTWPLLGSVPYLMKAGGAEYLHKYIDNLHSDLGPVFYTALTGERQIFIADTELNLLVYRAEGKYPVHIVPEAWTLYLEKTKQERGLFFMNGERWLENRRVLNQIILQPRSMQPHVEMFNSITKDLMSAWKANPTVEQLEYHLYNWNIECIGYLAFGTRLGFLKKFQQRNLQNQQKEKEEKDFVESIYSIFLESSTFNTFPPKIAKTLNLPSWKRFHKSISDSLQIGREYVESATENYHKGGQNVKCLINDLLKADSMDKHTLTVVLADFILAGADTTSQAALWSLYLLGRHPDVADKAREEIKRMIPDGEDLTFDTLRKMSYLNAIIKETFRLYPVAPFLTRKTTQDIIWKNYFIPAETWVITSITSMGRNAEYFSEPEKFLPERWLTKRRKNNSSEECGSQCGDTGMNLNKQAYIPWGLGGRSCIGKRIAQDELSILLLQTLLNFDWKIEEEIEPILRMITVPSKKVVLHLKPRRE